MNEIKQGQDGVKDATKPIGLISEAMTASQKLPQANPNPNRENMSYQV